MKYLISFAILLYPLLLAAKSTKIRFNGYRAGNGPPCCPFLSYPRAIELGKKIRGHFPGHKKAGTVITIGRIGIGLLANLTSSLHYRNFG